MFTFHNNKDMAPVHKLHFLKAYLEGQAYDSVTARYENKGAII